MMQRTPNASTRSGLHPCLRLFRVRLRHFRSARSFSGATRTKGLSSSAPVASPSTPATFLECVCSPRVRLRLSPKRQKHLIVRRCRNMRLPAEMCAHRRRNIRLPGRDMCPPTSEYVPLRGLPAPAVRNRLHGIIFRFLIAISIEIDSRGSILLNEEPSARLSYRLSSPGKKPYVKHQVTWYLFAGSRSLSRETPRMPIGIRQNLARARFLTRVMMRFREN